MVNCLFLQNVDEQTGRGGILQCGVDKMRSQICLKLIKMGIEPI